MDESPRYAMSSSTRSHASISQSIPRSHPEPTVIAFIDMRPESLFCGFFRCPHEYYCTHAVPMPSTFILTIVLTPCLYCRP